MRKLLFILLSIIIVITTSCSRTSTNKIQYLPCKTERKADWGFVDMKGNVVCADMFKNQPSYVRDGVFSVQESNGLYTLYAFDAKKPTILLEDLKYVGSPREGILPICKKDGRIEIIDTKGHTKFTLQSVNNTPISEAFSYFMYGYLLIATEDGKQGLVNNKGNIIIKPEYDRLLPLNKNFIFAVKNNDMFFIDENEKKYTDWKEDDIKNLLTFDWYEQPIEYIVVSKDDRLILYNQKGKQVLKCNDRVKGISEIKNGYFVYEGEDGYGVMNLKGERIVNDKYMGIKILNDGFIAKRDEKHDYELINKKGEVVNKIDDMEQVYLIDGFSYIGVDGSEVYVLNKAFVPAHKNALYQIVVGEYSYSDFIRSDYFDVDYVVGLVSTAKETSLYDKDVVFGKKLQDCSFLKQQSIDNYNRDYCRIPNYISSPLYSVNLKVYFDRTSYKSVYKNVTVERYNYYYGWYDDTQRQFSHYEKNPEAVINKLEFEITVPDSKEYDFFKKLCATLEHKYTTVKKVEDSIDDYGAYNRGYNIYADNHATYTVTTAEETIILEISQK